jgi:hypothetical protein
VGWGNKPAAEPGNGKLLVAIFATASTRGSAKAIFLKVSGFTGVCSAGAKRNSLMQRVNSLLRSAPSRIGRRLAEIVAIAAASLPSAGA